MTPQVFVSKWQKTALTERSSAQQHFLDLCDLLGHPKPADADPEGTWYTFERGVETTGGDKGWADVWKRGYFGWEYKGKHKDLNAAYQQLLKYREALENPPLLVVCDTDRLEIHTNFTGTVKRVHTINLTSLAEPANLDALRKLFHDPQALRPGETAVGITQDAAKRIGVIADSMRARGVPPRDAAHFLMKLMFCMFAEDIELLPARLFSRLLDGAKSDPPRLARMLKTLFEAMANGGDFGADPVRRFNGGLFDAADVIPLTPGEITQLIEANRHNWADVEPSIFGTLFERTLDPAKRSQIGAHYTSRDDILTLLEPVVMAPLRREWEAVKTRCDALWLKIQAESQKAAATSAGPSQKRSKPRAEFDKRIREFRENLAHVRILDPACGSGNFLYVAINLLLDLEKEVNAYAAPRGLSQLPMVRPTQLAGIEINQYAQELAQVVIWIGYLQWKRQNGFTPDTDPVLEPFESIRCMDAIIDLTNPDAPLEPEWPEADYIVGNPPFLGGKLLRTNLGDSYVDAVFNVWRDRVRAEADLCCYWFEKSRRQIERKQCNRAGLLATQGIRGGANRETLARIQETGRIFFAESDRSWILDGANVHISMVGFEAASKAAACVLDGHAVATINTNLTATADITTARRLSVNLNQSFMGDTKGGAFDISFAKALDLLQMPNVTGKSSSDVVVPWCNGMDVTRRARDMWIIDFGVETAAADAALYEAPFEYTRAQLYSVRQENKRESYKTRWWIHVEARPAMRDALRIVDRFIVTPTVAKHRVFAWMASPTLPDHQLIAIARSDDYFFGVLHSRIHETWTRAQGTQVRERESGFRYTPTTCFETFPFPIADEAQAAAIANAAKDLDTLRNNWLNPPEWTREEILEFPGSADGPWQRYVHDVNERGIGTVRYPRVVPKDDAFAKLLAKRTLTNLYNERPTWLDLAHRRLDEAVFAAYGWPAALSNEEILERLLELNLSRAASAQA